MRLCSPRLTTVHVVLFASVLAVVSVLSSGCTGQSDADPHDVIYPCTWIGNIDRQQFPEPSGIVFHPTRRTLFVVSDEGYVSEIEPDGAPVQIRRVTPQEIGGSVDFEGITVNPHTGRLYVVVEGDERLVELEPESLSIRRVFALSRTFRGDTVLAAGGHGVEGVTFVPDDGNSGNGTFYIANQAFDESRPGDRSVIVSVRLPEDNQGESTLPIDAGTLPLERVVTMRVTDISGLHYDHAQRRLLALSDANNVLASMTLAGEVERVWAFPGRDQEGITFDPDGYAYIAQDSGGIIKYRAFRNE